MRKIREVLRLKYELGLSQRQVAAGARVGKSTVWDYLLRFRESGLSLEESKQLDDSALKKRLFGEPFKSVEGRRVPDWREVHREMKRKGMTLSLLWQEYRQEHPEGYRYSRYCQLYRGWKKSLHVSLRHEYAGGEKLFVDYAGQTMMVTDPATGTERKAEIFVAALGASSYTFAHARWTQGLEDWIQSHILTFEDLGGVPEVVIPDNLKSGVSKANWYEPDINPTYAELAAHYDLAVLPARVRHPQDKAKVESAVLQVERWVLAPLRKQTFFSLEQLNSAMKGLVDELNDRPMKVLGCSRRDQFADVDQPALRPLPAGRYEHAEWSKATVSSDYHVERGGHYYSVPHRLIGERLEIRSTKTTLEVFYRSQRVAAHAVSLERGKKTTVQEHMPKAHREYLDWTPAKLVQWAQDTGPNTRCLVDHLLLSKKNPKQGYRSCLGLTSLARRYGDGRLEVACGRAVTLHSNSYKSVESILRSGLDQEEMHEESQQPVVCHDNVRGASYYSGEEVSSC